VYPSQTKEISVVVVNWNRCALLRCCLLSLVRQEGADFEVVLVDNGSNDGSVEMARREFGDTGRLALQVIENRENRGYCAANNQGFAASRSPLVALLNNDAEADPLWLQSLRRAFDEGNAWLGMAASKILVFEDPRRIDKAGHLIYLDGQNRGRGSGEFDNGQFDRLEEVIWPDGCAAMYRREMLDEIGGFDEDLFAYGDDAELGLRGRIAGWSCLYVPGAVVRHHRGATLGVLSSRRLQLIERNRVLLAAKLFPWSLLWLNGAFYLARIGAGLWAAATGQGEISRFQGTKGKVQAAMALINGDLEALRLLPKFLAKRREIRKFRRLTPSETRHLLMRHRITLRELMGQAI
jgi:GT2 family glycosyltransferase